MFYLFNKYRFLCLFILLILFCFFKAINAQLGYFEQISVVFGVLIFSNLFIIGHKERFLISLVCIVILIMISLYVLGFYYDKPIVDCFRLSIVICFFIFMTYLCLYYTTQDKTISITTLFGSISGYLLIGLIFAYVYSLIELLSPDSFLGIKGENEAKSIYFSFITLTTVGFGDIVPLKPIAQLITWLESFCGQLYLAVIIGQMIGRYVSEHKRTL